MFFFLPILPSHSIEIRVSPLFFFFCLFVSLTKSYRRNHRSNNLFSPKFNITLATSLFTVIQTRVPFPPSDDTLLSTEYCLRKGINRCAKIYTHSRDKSRRRVEYFSLEKNRSARIVIGRMIRCRRSI